MSRNFLFVAVIGIVLCSCTLSTQQEMKLNHDMQQFILVRNQGDALSFLNYIHPSIVRFYKDLGDSIFIEKFSITPQKNNINTAEEEVTLWNQGYIKKVIKKDNLIEAKIEISLKKRHQPIDSTLIYYAISNVNSTNWLFASEEDYLNILNKNERLFNKP